MKLLKIVLLVVLMVALPFSIKFISQKRKPIKQEQSLRFKQTVSLEIPQLEISYEV